MQTNVWIVVRHHIVMLGISARTVSNGVIGSFGSRGDDKSWAAPKPLTNEGDMAGLAKSNLVTSYDPHRGEIVRLREALYADDPDVFLATLEQVAKAEGVAQIAAISGLSRESLYKAIKPGSKLRFETVRKIISALGFRITVEIDPKNVGADRTRL